MIQTPIVSNVWGIPGTTYSGAVNGTSTCTPQIGGTGVSQNGCPALDNYVTFTTHLGMDAAGDMAVAQSSQPGGVHALYQVAALWRRCS